MMMDGIKFLHIIVDPGSKDDPNELTFKKGQILQVIDKSGKWWLARNKDGRKGSTSHPFPMYHHFIPESPSCTSCAFQLSATPVTSQPEIYEIYGECLYITNLARIYASIYVF